MILIEDDFKKDIFSKLMKRYKCGFLTNELKITHGSLYRYKNTHGVSVPESIVKNCLQMTGIGENELNNHTIKTFEPKELRHKCLNIGREIRKKQLKKWRDELPKSADIVKNGYLNLEKWFYHYRRLIDFGSRRIESVDIKDNRIIIKHKNYVKGKQRDFTVVLPRKIYINNDFIYFFGLWCGDRVGGGRIGIANKSIELNRATEEYLKNGLYQEPRFVVLKSSRIDRLPDFDFKVESVQVVKGMPGSWVACVQSVNGILKSFFDQLLEDLDSFLRILPKRNIFFAGLFDAEGNVFLEDGCFRWACKNTRRVDIYERHLKEYGLFNRYDGGNIVTNNSDVFSSLILPYMKNKEKINKAKLLCCGVGYLDKRFRKILNTVKNNPNKEVSRLARIMGRKKLWPQIRFLERYKYVESKEYPKMIFITDKGINELRREGQK
jgi:hypothetical protein